MPQHQVHSTTMDQYHISHGPEEDTPQQVVDYSTVDVASPKTTTVDVFYSQHGRRNGSFIYPWNKRAAVVYAEIACSCSPSIANECAKPIHAGPKCGSIIDDLLKYRRASEILSIDR
jgi:hypothetical protein